MNERDWIVRAQSVSLNYRQDGVETPALREVDFGVGRGEFMSIMGPSGCGKSTLLHVLGLMLRPTRAGELALDGSSVLGLSQTELTRLRREKIGFVFQRFNLLDVLTARDNLKLALEIKKRPVGNRVGEFLDLVGLSNKANRKPHQMSIGEQQRLAIARAIIHEPALLLADEPTGNLDSDNTERVMDLLRSCHKRFGQTIVMVTHNPDLAKRTDRVVYMKDGKVVANG